MQLTDKFLDDLKFLASQKLQTSKDNIKMQLQEITLNSQSVQLSINLIFVLDLYFMVAGSTILYLFNGSDRIASFNDTETGIITQSIPLNMFVDSYYTAYSTFPCRLFGYVFTKIH